MNTNFRMIKELINEKKFTPKIKGYLDNEEIEIIKDTLCIDKMDILALRNLRDFIVVFLGNCEGKIGENETINFLDIISGITCLIDRRIFELGGEI